MLGFDSIPLIASLITGTASGTVIAVITAWAFSKRDDKSRASYERSMIAQVKAVHEMAEAFKTELVKCQDSQKETQALVIQLIKDNAELKTKVEYLEKKNAA